MSSGACHASASHPSIPSVVSLYEILWQGLDAQSHGLSHDQSLVQSHVDCTNARHDVFRPEATLPLGRLVQRKSKQQSQRLNLETVEERTVEQHQQQHQRQRSQLMGCFPSRSSVDCCFIAGADTVKTSANVGSSATFTSTSGIQSGLDSTVPRSRHILDYRISQKRGQERSVTVAGDKKCGSGSYCPSKPNTQPLWADSLQTAPLGASAPSSSLKESSEPASERVHEVPDEVLRHIFSRLSVADLPRVAAVCRRWRPLALDPSLCCAAFCRSHHLLSLRLSPSAAPAPPTPASASASASASATPVPEAKGDKLSSPLLHSASTPASRSHAHLHSPHPPSSSAALIARRSPPPLLSLLASPEFALSHPIGRTDSIASLAVRFHVQAMDIRRLNNIISDHAIHTRTRLLIPIPAARRPAELAGRHCAVQFDSHARREVLLVFQEGEEGEIRQAYGEARNARPSAAHGTAQVVSLLQRALQVDEPTAQYYLGEAGGDVRAAVALFMEDQQWERAQAQAGERRKSLGIGCRRGRAGDRL